MTWEEKLHALDLLAGVGSLHMRVPGDWLCSHSLDIKDRSLLVGGCGNGKTPQEAVEDQWARLTERLEPYQYIVIDRSGGPRRSVRWNGFMWADVKETEAA